ncbi:hypothetical protein AWN90_05385 [Nocardia terpenica]|uniref:Uncharacterized protein n=1 Tax=Nocardia terpenica TaxID=455432 RepID=A0A164J404_9NOCA|nr:hypothetical protein AWN90_05385 [Nocardia terpenica]
MRSSVAQNPRPTMAVIPPSLASMNRGLPVRNDTPTTSARMLSVSTPSMSTRRRVTTDQIARTAGGTMPRNSASH